MKKKELIFMMMAIIAYCFSCNKKNKQQQIKNSSEEKINCDNVSHKNINYVMKDIRYVNSENGLSYRDAPNGNKIDVFPYNTSLNVIGVVDTCKETKRQWLLVQKGKDTVYVLSKFLSHSHNVSNLPKENEYFIDHVKDLINDNQYVQEYINDTILAKEIPIEKFMAIQKTSENRFDSVFKKYNSLRKENQIKKLNSVIKINCFNNKTLSYKDSYPEHDEEIETYHYLGTQKSINSILILKSGYEWDSYILVNKDSCKVNEFHGYPIFSSNYSKMIAINTDSYKYSYFMIYTTENGRYKLVNTFTLDLIVSKSVLDNNNNLYLEYTVEWNDGKEQKKSSQYFFINFLN